MKLSPTITNSEVIKNLQIRLGDRKAPELRLTIVYELNVLLGQLEDGPVWPWFMVKTASLTFLPGEYKKELPADFILELEEDQPALLEQGVLLGFLRKTDVAHLSEFPVGPPSHYSIVGNEIILAPVTTVEQTVEFRYYGASTPVVDNTEVVTNPWLVNAYNFTTFSVLAHIARHIVKSDEMAMRFDKDAATAGKAFWILDEARKQANADYVIDD